MQSESTDLEQNLLNHLECPVCYELIRPPITMCVNGHNICNICKQQVSDCPKCKEEFVSARNLALEDLARQVMYPCKYRSNGCTENFNLDKIVVHEATCRYIPQVCPVAKLGIGICSWSGSYNDIKAHLEENHFEECCEYVEGDCKFTFRLAGDMIYPRFLFAYNEIFFFLFQQKDERFKCVLEKMFSAVLLYIGPSENASKYKYRVEFVNEDDTHGFAVWHLARSSDEDLDDLYKSGKYVKFHCELLIPLVDEEDNVKFKLEIIRVGN